MLTDDDREILRQVAAHTEKLVNEVRRLRGDVMRLHGRIVPFDSEVVVTEVPALPGVAGARQRRWRLVDALNLIADARREIIDAEMHLSAIRARMDEIASDAISREEMKPYINHSSRSRGEP